MGVVSRTDLLRVGRAKSAFGRRAPLLELIEDHDYDVAPSNAFNQEHARMYRRRMLQTVVAPRNL